MRSALVLFVLGCSAPAGNLAHAEPPPLNTYRAVWVRLAAERNETSEASFLARVHADAPRLECFHTGTCTVSFSYTYAIGWIVMRERDVIYVRQQRDGPWFGEAQIREDLASGSEAGHVARMRTFDGVLAFASREEAGAAFVSHFGHRPAGVVWSGRRPLSPTKDQPKLVGRSTACRTEVLDLVTGRPAIEQDEVCFAE